MNLQAWAGVGIVCGTILGIYAVLVLIWKGIQGMWRRARKAEDLFNQLLTNNQQLAANNVQLAAVVSGLADLTDRFEEHLALPHGNPGGQPPTWVQPKPNGPRPGRRTP